MSFGIYIVGYLIVIIGLAYGATLMHMPAHWIGVGVIRTDRPGNLDGRQENPPKGLVELACSGQSRSGSGY